MTAIVAPGRVHYYSAIVMRLNRSPLRKSISRRAHRPDQQTYRTMRRRRQPGSRVIFWIEIVLGLAILLVLGLFLRWLW